MFLLGAPYCEPEPAAIERSAALAYLHPPVAAKAQATAQTLVEAIRAGHSLIGGIDDFLHAYGLTTREGLALMALAEALLRVPDAATADRLIEDKLAHLQNGGGHAGRRPVLVYASSWALAAAARLIHPGETPDDIVSGLVKRVGLPAVRVAARQAMGVLGNHFVLGETIEEALAKAQSKSGRGWRYSFDMLGEGARTQADADGYFAAYAHAIRRIGEASQGEAGRLGVSVKLSALHPRFEARKRDRVRSELPARLIELAALAREAGAGLTVDAEEADRLELSLEIIGAVMGDPVLKGWDGFGFAVQAYQKRALAVIDWAAERAQAHGRKLSLRLVKGAYWDTEIKRAQERGLWDYPVFTRKAATDMNYLACAQKLLAARPLIYPQFATHNALTLASVAELAGDGGHEFQRLYGMGEALYAAFRSQRPDAPCRVYAPVGGHKDLLAYLVRRLLENGANSSFVSAAADARVPMAELIRQPLETLRVAHSGKSRIPLPPDLYGAERRNSAGHELGHRETLTRLCAGIAAAPLPAAARMSGADELSGAEASAIIERAAGAFPVWEATPAAERCACLERAADAFEAQSSLFLKLLIVEAGKTIDDAIAELRETVDFCRYYAAEARRQFSHPLILPGPTGEANTLRHRGRGVFICISPWNFPLAIFTGQLAAALAAGNSAVVKPAPQTPLIAAEAVRVLHEAGVPPDALILAPGGAATGGALVAHPSVGGVAFTGSTQTAWAINRALAAKDGPIVPLIAETGGINAMIADSTALPEQVTDDVIASAFRSAGQRCSALRLLCLPDETADAALRMIEGAMRELTLGNPLDPATDIGPVIDGDAKRRLDSYMAERRAAGQVIRCWEDDHVLPGGGHYVGPCIIGLKRAGELRREIFGPALHVVRWRAAELDALLADIESTGYGLTLGVHSRIDGFVERIASRMRTGNIYVNRNMIGAVVGVQPFGGAGLSGTGPKAGGPDYLRRFTAEQTLSVNTAAAGGDAALLGEAG